MRSILRWLVFSILVVWLLLVSILTVCYGLLSTTGGSQWLIEKVGTAVEQLDISWSSIDGSLMRGLEFGNLDVSAQGNRVQAELFSVDWDLFDLLQAEFALGDLSVRNLVISLPESAEDSSSGNQVWPEISLPIALSLDSARIEHMQIIQAGVATSLLEIDLLELSADLRSGNLRINQLILEQGAQGMELAGRVELAPPYPMTFDVQWHGEIPQENDNLILEGEGNLAGNLVEISLNHHLLKPLLLDTDGTLATGFDQGQMGLQPGSFVIDVQNNWVLNNWAIPGQDYHLTSSGELSLRGGLDLSRISGQFSLLIPELEQLPQQQIELDAEVQGKTANLHQFGIDTGFGLIAGTGELHWDGEPSWDLALQLTDFNPGHFVPEIPGSIQSVLTHSGQVNGDSVDAQVHIDELEGQIRGFPLSSSGGLAFRENSFFANDLIVRAGENRLRLNAELGSEMNLSWDLAAPKLSQLYPQLAGILNMTGTATGQLAEPEIRTLISAQSIQFQDISAGNVEASISGSLQAGQSLQLTVDNLVRGEQQANLGLSMSGSLNQHEYSLQLTTRIAAEEITAQINGAAIFDGQSWESGLEQLMLGLGFAGQWSLDDSEETAHLSVARNRVSVSPFCLQNGTSSICATEAGFQDGEINLAASLERFHLELLNEFLPQDTRISGALGGNLALAGAMDELEGNIALDAPEIVLTISQLQETEFHQLSMSTLTGDFIGGLLNLSLSSQLAGNGLIDGQAQIDMRVDEKPIDARLQARFSELTWLDPFLPQLSDLDGDTDIDIQVTGALQQPVIGGDVHMANLTAFVPEAGILLEQGRIDLVNRSAGNWDLSASVISGGGNLGMEGKLALSSPSDWNMDLAINGDEFHAYAQDSIQVYVSPELNFAFSPQLIDVSGDVLLPRADFIIKSLPASTVNVSRDEVIISEQPQAEATAQQGPAFVADVNLMLGDQVMFEGFNIKGRLAGQLRLRESPGASQRVEGSIEIIDGTYEAYGQELTIDPGQLVFNGPAENPRLNVRAYRTVGDNLVGVHLGGTVETLSSSLYSTPALPQTEILSLLVTGKSLSNTTSNEGDQLVSALTSLGISQSALITESLQNTLNLDVLEISASEDIEESSVTIGKYLSPRLFVSYAQDILTPNSSVSLDYFLSDKIKINAKSGAAQSMDIFYRFERCPDC